jgi:hypothetical protein
MVQNEPRGDHEHTRLSAMIVATSLGFMLVQLDVSILNVALARTGSEFGAGVSGLHQPQVEPRDKMTKMRIQKVSIE